MAAKAINGTDSRKNDRLLPCPFCGGNDVHVGWTDFDSGVIFVECESCGMHCEPKDCYANEPKAIAAWNRRAETKTERDLRDEVNWMHAELHGAEMAASGETVLLDEQYSHAMRLVEELHQVLSLSGGGYLDEYGSQVDGGAGAAS